MVGQTHGCLIPLALDAATEQLEKAILNKCYVSKYITKLEDEENKHVEGLRIISTENNVANPFQDTTRMQTQKEAIGTVYKIEMQIHSACFNGEQHSSKKSH